MTHVLVPARVEEYPDLTRLLRRSPAPARPVLILAHRLLLTIARRGRA